MRNIENNIVSDWSPAHNNPQSTDDISILNFSYEKLMHDHIRLNAKPVSKSWTEFKIKIAALQIKDKSVL